MTQRYLSLLAAGFFLGSSIQVFAQPVEELVPISARPQTYIPAKVKKKVTASVTLPFFDDFSYDQHHPDTLLWEDAHVYINQTYAQSPPTLGVATFDGLDQAGLAYDLENLNTDSCDVLTSRPIDLSAPVDSVYLSFFWQAGGLGERPETNDSLNLKFFSPQTNSWFRVWGISGEDSTGFKQVMVPVTGTQYLRDGFKFRFTSFGAQAGAFDTWNIDYVRLDDQRTKNDTAFKDPAFTRPHPSLLKNFEAVPWFHYNSTLQNIENEDTLILHYRRNVDPNQSSYFLSLAAFKIWSGATVLAFNNSGDPTIDNTHADNIEEDYRSPVFTPSNSTAGFKLPSPPTDEFVIMGYQTYEGNQVAENENDTIRKTQTFKNYYALDDGTAERAYQVRDNIGGFIITKYDIAEADDILGLYLYFLPSQYDIEENQFSIVVYQNNGGLPGNLIYESDSLYTPRYTSSNFLLPYQLDAPVSVTGPVFVGIRQKSNVRLPIGFDLNTPTRGEKFYGNLGPTLTQSFISGNLMMRPYLRYQPKDLSVENPKPGEIELAIYPNPAHDILRVERPDSHLELNYYLSNISGQVLQSGVLRSEIRLGTNVNSGIYLLRIEDPTGTKAPVVKKILVKR